jgi:UDP-N-acetyl-D-glucosamine dehydrogenase
MKEALLEKIGSRKAQVAVVGLGYVGLPLALRFSECGFRVIGIDTDAERAAQLARGETYIARYGAERITQALKRGFLPTHNFSEAAKADAILICVPTPLTAQREPDLGHVRAAAEALLPYLCAGQLVSLESTTYPGTTDEEIITRIQKRLSESAAMSSYASRRSARIPAMRAFRRTPSPRSSAARRPIAWKRGLRSTARPSTAWSR